MIEFLGPIGIWSVRFCGGRKNGVPGEKSLAQGREPTTNSTHMWRRVRESNPCQSGGRRVLSPLLHLCTSQKFCASLPLVWIDRVSSAFFQICDRLYMSFENGLFKGSNKTLATPRCMYRLLISFGRSWTWARRYRCSRACVLSVVLVAQIVVQIQANVVVLRKTVHWNLIRFASVAKR